VGIISDVEMEMGLVRVDDKFRIVIPKRLRDTIGIFGRSILYICAFESMIFLKKSGFDKTSVIDSIKKLSDSEVDENAKK